MSSTKKKYYYLVAPLIKTGFGETSFFTYYSREKISPGSLVEIPFGKKSITGITFKPAPKPSFPTKPIRKILSPAIITPFQALLAQEISSLYKHCLGKCLKLFIPPLTKKERTAKEIPLETIKALAPKPALKNFLSLSPKELKTISALFSTNQPMGHLDQSALWSPSFAKKKNISKKSSYGKKNDFLLKGPFWKRKAFAFELARQTLEKNGRQGMLLLPDLASSQRTFAETLSLANKKHWDKIALLNSETSPAVFWGSYQKIKTGKIKVIVATRRGLFLPFKKLDWIFIENEHSANFNQSDQSPAFHASKIVEILTEIFGAKAIFSSLTPSLESFLLSEKKCRPHLFSTRNPLKKLPLAKNKSRRTKKDEKAFEIVNSARYFFQTKDHLIISQEAQQAIWKSLRQKKPVFIFVRQKGHSRKVICQNCKKTFLCSACNIPLMALKDGYQCPSCKKRESLFARCPHCQSIQLKTIGFGQEKAQEKIESLFPDFPVIKADAMAIKNISKVSRLLQLFLLPKPPLVVGGIGALRLFENQPFGAFIVLDGDDFSRIGFEADLERLADFFEIYEKVRWLNLKNQASKAIFQTFNPQNKEWSLIKKNQWEKILRQEAKLRKGLSYPPFSFIIKLEKRNKSPQALEKSYQKIYNNLLRKPEKRNHLKVYLPEKGLLRKNQSAKNKEFKAIFYLKIISFIFFQKKACQKILGSLAKDDWKINFHPRLIG